MNEARPLNPLTGVTVNDPSGLRTTVADVDGGGATSTAVSGPSWSLLVSLASTPGAGAVPPLNGKANGPSPAAVGRCGSTAPMVRGVPRGLPRWSVVRAAEDTAGSAAPRAGLPALGATVWVRPPL